MCHFLCALGSAITHLHLATHLYFSFSLLMHRVVILESKFRQKDQLDKIMGVVRKREFAMKDSCYFVPPHHVIPSEETNIKDDKI